MLTVIIVFLLVAFLCTTVLSAHSTVDQQTVNRHVYIGRTQEFQFWSTRLLVMMETKWVLQITTGNRKLSQWACSIGHVTSLSHLSRLQLEDCEDLDSLFIRRPELLARLHEAGESISETLLNASILNGLPMRHKTFVIQEAFNPTQTPKSWGKGCRAMRTRRSDRRYKEHSWI